MIAPRRFFPSITSLRALEAFERLGSVTSAAEELDLTQSAVSRQLQTLEEQIGVRLFVRQKKRLFLTTAGVDYVQEIREGLSRISVAALQLKANPSGSGFNLATPPGFAARWLVPRLPDFIARHPQVTVNLGSRLSSIDFEKENFDAAIHFGAPDWPNVECEFLMSETLLPVAAPSVATALASPDVQDMLNAPLPHLESRPNAWEQWARQHGVEPGPLTGMLFDQFSTMIEATVQGIGLALLPSFLIEEELTKGQLVALIDVPTQSDDAYYFVWPKKRAHYTPVVAFREWLQTLS